MYFSDVCIELLEVYQYAADEEPMPFAAKRRKFVENDSPKSVGKLPSLVIDSPEIVRQATVEEMVCTFK
jgi:hypothetical protein